MGRKFFVMKESPNLKTGDTSASLSLLGKVLFATSRLKKCKIFSATTRNRFDNIRFPASVLIGGKTEHELFLSCLFRADDV